NCHMEKKFFSAECCRTVARSALRLLLIFSLIQLAALTVLAQSTRVTGTVKDIQGKPLSGVSVVVKGTTNGTTTDVDGKFTIEVPNQRSVLVLTLIGHADKEETVGNRKALDITMGETVSSLDEVVVIGYGTQKKRDVTGAITSISNKQIAERV